MKIENTEENQSNYAINQWLTEIETAISSAKSKMLENVKNIRAWGFLTFIFSIFIILHYMKIFVLSTWVIVLFWIIVVFLLLAIYGTDVSKLKIEVDKYETIKKNYLSLFSGKQEDTHFDSLVKINIDNLADYYSLVKIHTSQSFKLSSFVGLVGFSLIITSILMGYYDRTLKDISYLSAITGIIIEFISGIFFYLYNKTVMQLKNYHDSLLDVQNILLSFKLIEQTKDEKERSVMTQKMIEFLVGKKREK